MADGRKTAFMGNMVGLGKTVQLAMAGMFMALWGDKPVLSHRVS